MNRIPALSLLADACGFFAGIWIKDLLFLLFGLVFAQNFGLRVNAVSVFGLTFTWNTDGTWTKGARKFSPLIQHSLIGRRNADGQYEKDHELLYSVVRTLVLAACTGVVLYVCNYPLRVCIWGVPGYSELFIGWLCIGLCWMVLQTAGIMIYVYGISMRRLGGYVRQITRRMRQGESLSAMGLQPLDTLPYKNPGKPERLLYLGIYLTMLLLEERTNELKAPTEQLAACMTQEQFLLPETLAYYWMVFYYSRYELNPALAQSYLSRCASAIYQDKDANARRVLAYYAFGTERDPVRTRKYLDEAWEALDRFSSGEERELERRLLQELEWHLQQQKA